MQQSMCCFKGAADSNLDYFKLVEGNKKEERQREGEGFKEMTSECDRREMKDVETERKKGREGCKLIGRYGGGIYEGPLFLLLECSFDTVCCSEEKERKKKLAVSFFSFRCSLWLRPVRGG